MAVIQEQRARLLSFLAHGTGGPSTAEDLLQEALLRTWDHRASLDTDAEGARRYLWRVARNLLIDEIRWRRRRRAREERDPELIGAAPDVSGGEQVVEREECLRVLRETVDGLANQRVRRCVELWIAGCDLPVIAAQLGLASGQVRGLLQRGRSEIVRRAAARLRAPQGAPPRPHPDRRVRYHPAAIMRAAMRSA